MDVTMPWTLHKQPADLVADHAYSIFDANVRPSSSCFGSVCRRSDCYVRGSINEHHARLGKGQRMTDRANDNLTADLPDGFLREWAGCWNLDCLPECQVRLESGYCRRMDIALAEYRERTAEANDRAEPAH